LEGIIKNVTDEDERRSTVEAQVTAFEVISAFFKDFPTLIKPYVKMHQKAPWF
jgi:CRISPR/Cas system CSM-associated protein Csm2 small subunit